MFLSRSRFFSCSKTRTVLPYPVSYLVLSNFSSSFALTSSSASLLTFPSRDAFIESLIAPVDSIWLIAVSLSIFAYSSSFLPVYSAKAALATTSFLDTSFSICSSEILFQSHWPKTAPANLLFFTPGWSPVTSMSSPVASSIKRYNAPLWINV